MVREIWAQGLIPVRSGPKFILGGLGNNQWKKRFLQSTNGWKQSCTTSRWEKISCPREFPNFPPPALPSKNKGPSLNVLFSAKVYSQSFSLRVQWKMVLDKRIQDCQWYLILRDWRWRRLNVLLFLSSPTGGYWLYLRVRLTKLTGIL